MQQTRPMLGGFLVLYDQYLHKNMVMTQFLLPTSILAQLVRLGRPHLGRNRLRQPLLAGS